MADHPPDSTDVKLSDLLLQPPYGVAEPRVTLGGANGYVRLNRAAYALMGKPTHVQLFAGQVNGARYIALRPCEGTAEEARPIQMPSGKNNKNGQPTDAKITARKLFNDWGFIRGLRHFGLSQRDDAFWIEIPDEKS